MAFSLIVADEMGAVQAHEKSQLASMERRHRRSWPITLAAPEKDAIFLGPNDSGVTRHPPTCRHIHEPTSQHLATA
jgi:hypothetical protein